METNRYGLYEDRKSKRGGIRMQFAVCKEVMTPKNVKYQSGFARNTLKIVRR